MVPRENKDNTYAKFGETNKEYYGIFRKGLFNFNFNLNSQKYQYYSVRKRKVEYIYRLHIEDDK